MIHIMNSAIMPAGCYGEYSYRESSLLELEEILRGFYGEWKSCIGYPQNAELIKKWIGFDVPISRDDTVFKDGDSAFIMRLRKRVANPATKGMPVSDNPNDWEFAFVEFRST